MKLTSTDSVFAIFVRTPSGYEIPILMVTDELSPGPRALRTRATNFLEDGGIDVGEIIEILNLDDLLATRVRTVCGILRNLDFLYPTMLRRGHTGSATVVLNMARLWAQFATAVGASDVELNRALGDLAYSL